MDDDDDDDIPNRAGQRRQSWVHVLKDYFQHQVTLTPVTDDDEDDIYNGITSNY